MKLSVDSDVLLSDSFGPRAPNILRNENETPFSVLFSRVAVVNKALNSQPDCMQISSTQTSHRIQSAPDSELDSVFDPPWRNLLRA